MQAATIPTTLRTDYASILRTYSTEEAATILKVRPQTLRAAVCRDGHYFGVRPQKARNRFLIWDAAAVDALLNGEVA
ncbi:hypothetical protein [Zoogloea sp. 1C4]|mgnify:CR=1 FL=1|jgi:hypothetical protein|uniref:hypothetical protein n=1 Tax=Zoogloea sp. 1C4 TaxID=2570190 RepID=UPI0012916D67|nr:hypothetical protein [Zoogloea sp. 1C4]